MKKIKKSSSKVGKQNIKKHQSGTDESSEKDRSLLKPHEYLMYAYLSKITPLITLRKRKELKLSVKQLKKIGIGLDQESAERLQKNITAIDDQIVKKKDEILETITQALEKDLYPAEIKEALIKGNVLVRPSYVHIIDPAILKHIEKLFSEQLILTLERNSLLYKNKLKINIITQQLEPLDPATVVFPVRGKNLALATDLKANEFYFANMLNLPESQNLNREYCAAVKEYFFPNDFITMRLDLTYSIAELKKAFNELITRVKKLNAMSTNIK